MTMLVKDAQDEHFTRSHAQWARIRAGFDIVSHEYGLYTLSQSHDLDHIAYKMIYVIVKTIKELSFLELILVARNTIVMTVHANQFQSGAYHYKSNFQDSVNSLLPWSASGL